MGPLAAVAVRDLRLSYSRSSPPVIDGANMTIPKGAIYGLLGASGCGKTSLLKCLVGLSKPDSGAVLIFGQQLHEGLVPGPGVGFMPQELALHSDFTIAENMYFFGQLLGMPLKKIYERIAFLCSFFQLLPANRFVEHLSGGQQRRVSLAVALMHQPPFLILDEPTVGLDPVLREAIWRYFLVLSEENGVTLLVTTHFIEEIAKAAMVGVMKNGKIWCELPPTELMETYGAATLAESYLKVCQALDFPPPPAEKQAQPIPEKQKPQPVPEKPQPEPLRRPRLAPATPVQPCPVPESLLTWANWGPVRSCLRLRALVVKNLLKIMRRVITVVFQLVVPSCVGVVFCLFVGGKPSNLPVGVVNEDQHGAFSRAFLGEVSNETVVQKPYSDLHKAFSAVLDEQAWGTLHIPANYTIALNTRVHSGKIEDSSPQIPINFFLDATDYTIRNTLQFEIVEAHSRYLKLLSYNLTSLNFSVQTIRFTDPFYNAFDFTFREFMSPGIIVSTLFAMSMSLTALLLVAENQEGIRGRSVVAGVTSVEVIVGHAVVQMSMAYMQTVLMLVVFVSVFDTPVRGSLGAAFFIPVLMALCGMNFGFLTSSVSKDEATALLLSMAALYPALLMGGVLWPVEGTPAVLRPVSWSVPQALPAHAMRGVMLRNYTFDDSHVVQAVGATSLWTVAFMALSMIMYSLSK
ncbi:ABC transporter G family member 23-like isoform X2 [Dermacentor albipictus]|uniref:ABC transporter G family member 23-like isoform X2 n=1 Tax=Dermacentor albipictus TaxID=60249 RepID=UPI0031FC2F63